MVKARKNGGKKSTSNSTQKYVAASDLPRKTIEDSLTLTKPIYENYADNSVSWDEIAAGVRCELLIRASSASEKKLCIAFTNSRVRFCKIHLAIR